MEGRGVTLPRPALRTHLLGVRLRVRLRLRLRVRVGAGVRVRVGVRVREGEQRSVVTHLRDEAAAAALLRERFGDQLEE